MAKSVSGMHLGSGAITALALRPAKRGWTVIGGASEPITGEADEDLAPHFKVLAKSLKLRAGDQVTVSLSKQRAIIRNVTLPSVDPAELDQMTRFEAERHIPFNAERHSVGYHLLRSMGVEGSEVVLAAVDGPIVKRAVDGLINDGRIPDGITVSSTALVNSLLHEKKDQIAERTVAVLCIGLQTVDLVFVSHGRLLYARSALMDLRSALETWVGHKPGGEGEGDDDHRPDRAKLAVAAHMIDCQNLTSHESTMSGHDPAREGARLVEHWIDRVAKELQRTYDFARREMKCPPIEAVYITGEGAALRNLDKFLSQGSELEVEVLNPVAKLPGAAEQKFPYGGLEYVLAFGAISGRHDQGAYRIDLTPTEYYRNLSRRATVRRLIFSAVVLVITLGLSGFSFVRYKSTREQESRDYQQINSRMRPEVVELEQMQTKLKIIRTFVDDPNAALKVFNQVLGDRRIPTNIFLQKYAFTKGDEVRIEGMAKDIPTINSLIAYLDGTGHFIEITSSHDPTSLLGKPVYRFTLICPLMVSEKERRR